MRKPEKVSPTESSLLFEMDPEPAPELLTALGGIPIRVYLRISELDQGNTRWRASVSLLG